MHPAARFALQAGAQLARSRTARTLLLAALIVWLAVSLVMTLIPLVLAAGLLQLQPAGSNGGCGPITIGGGGSVAGVTSQQARTAETIWAVTRAVGLSEQAAVIAIATAIQESSLGADPTMTRPNSDGDAGVFQQRVLPGWYGTLDQVLDVGYATRTFLLGHTVTGDQVAAARAAGVTPAGPVGYIIPGLVQIPGWQQLSLTQAAQAVQRSAFPDAYARHEQTALALVATFTTGTPTAALCAGSAGALMCPPSGLAAEQGLTSDAVRVVRCAHQHFPQITSIGGVGDRPSNVDDDHQTGRAVDVMIPTWDTPAGQLLGDQVADWAKTNAATLGVKYVIWQARIWSVARQTEGWRPCSARSCYAGPDPTLSHLDHVHISVYGNTAGTPTPAGGSAELVSPLAGAYVPTAGFGQCGSSWVACHTGQDLAAPVGTPIRAVLAGTVTTAGWAGAYGNLVVIDHGRGLTTWYAHQDHLTVTVGQRVTAGETVGSVGFTGNVKPVGPAGAHLHFEVRIDGSPVDPVPWLAARGVTL